MTRPLLLIFVLLAPPLRGLPQQKIAFQTSQAAAANDRYVLQNGAVVLRQGTQDKPLTQNVRLANGTKINYKNGIVEFPTGKITTLREGDYVTAQGEVVFATPASAAAARGDSSVPASAKFDPYVQRGAQPSAADVESRLAGMNAKITLMAQKIQLLNEKISLLSTSTQRPPDTSQLDSQIRKLDEQLKQVK